jgi:hypothetical protein
MAKHTSGNILEGFKHRIKKVRTVYGRFSLYFSNQMFVICQQAFSAAFVETQFNLKKTVQKKTMCSIWEGQKNEGHCVEPFFFVLHSKKWNRQKSLAWTWQTFVYSN